MTSQTAVAYVIKARLFVSHALSRATAAARRRIQLGNGNFTDECYQMVLRSHYLPLHQRSESRAIENQSYKFDNRLYIFETGYRF